MRFLAGAAVAAILAPSLLAPSAAQAASLEDALAAAYRNNPTLEAARLSAAAADEDRAQARAEYLPTLDVVASAGTRSGETNGVDDADTDPRSVSYIANQGLFTGGFRVARSRLARANVDAAREELRAVEQGVLLSVIAAYVDVRRDEEFVRIRQSNVTVLEQQESEAEARFEVGDITRTDVAQSEARLAGARSGLSAAQAALEGSRARYLQVVGEAPDALAAPPQPPDIPRSLDEAVEQAIALNPDLRQARTGERAARAQTGIERSALLPQISVVGRYDQSEDVGAPGVESDGVSATAQISVPLFEGGFARSRVRQSRINERRAAEVTEQARRQVVAGVTSAWNDYLAAQRVVESSHAQLEANQLALEGVQEERSVGLRTTLDVLNAQQEYLDAQLTLVSAERDQYVAQHVLLQSLGRLDAAVLAVNAPLYDPAEHGRAVTRTLLSTEPADIPLRGR